MVNLKVSDLMIKIYDKLILDGINIDFKAEKKTAIIGPNGCGKSTLLKAISGLNRQYKGEILIDGENILHLSRKNLAKKMAILPQGATTPTDLTVKELVSYGRFPYRYMFKSLNSKKEQAIIEEAMEKTHITSFSHRLVSTLSGGERQRTWIAMALAQQPKILLLDEPTTYLDIAHQIEVMQIVDELNKREKMTVIMVLHDINHARMYADDIVILKDKHVFEQGEPNTVLDVENLAKVFGVNAKMYQNYQNPEDKIIFPVSLVEIKSLKKNFVSKNKQGKNIEKTAVKDLNLTIDEGEIFGLLGPNGAGKTTTIRMLTMLTKPTAGEILYKGKDIFSDELNVKKYIGVVPQHINFDQDLTVWENMELHGRLHHIPKSQRHARIEELLNYVELQDRVNDKVKSLSGGMKRRLLIVRALMHNPKILFLDEPTVALDPQVRRRIWDLIRRLPKDGVTVVLTTHYIEEAENLCNRVAILNKGSLIKLDTPKALCEQIGKYVVEWDSEKSREYKFFNSRKECADFAGTLDVATTIRHSNLEDVFVELTGRTVS